MKRIFTILCVALVTLGTMNAKIVMTEHFDGDNGVVGQLSKGTNSDMGTNTANWWSFSGSSNYIQVAEGGLAYSGYQSTGVGNKASLGIYSSAADDLRQFSPAISSGKVYLAAIVNVETLKSSITADYCLSLGNATASGMYAKLYTKSVKEGENWVGFKFGVAKNNESATYVRTTNQTYTPNTNYLVVVEYDFIEGDQNDTVRLYVNPTKATTEPTLVCVQDTVSGSGAAQGANAKNDAGSISSVNLRQGSTTPKVYIDEIKVATTWGELWESSGTPAITYTGSAAFGSVTVNDPATVDLYVSGSDLLGDISVQSNNTMVTPSSYVVTKADALAAGGSKLTLTLTALTEGDGTASITLKSNGATDVVIPVSWSASTGVTKLSIAEAKLKAEGDLVTLKDVVVIRKFNYAGNASMTVQDETGALNLYACDSWSWNVGEKISGMQGYVIESAEYTEGFFSIYPTNGTVAASGVSVDPFSVTLDNIAQYGPALVKVTGVSFDSTGKFASGNYAITKDSKSAEISIISGCDIIGEDIPAQADVTGIVTHPFSKNFIEIRSKADVSNRVPTGLEETASGKRKAEKFIRNGQLIIVRDGKMLNVLGAEL